MGSCSKWNNGKGDGKEHGKNMENEAEMGTGILQGVIRINILLII